MPPIFNLVADLRRPFSVEPIGGVAFSPPHSADERTLAWIDDVFGGSWSSEACAGLTIVAHRDEAPIGFATVGATGLSFSWLRGLAQEPDVGLFGPFGVIPHARKTGIGVSLLRRGLNALGDLGYTRALLAAANQGLLQYYGNAAGARIAERFERDALLRSGRRVLVMASGNGSNFQAVLDAARSSELPIDIVGLLCNNPAAHALTRARDAGVKAVHVIAWERLRETRKAYDARLLETARTTEPDLVLLLGWMHLLSDSFVGAFPEMLNLHPAFLPLNPAQDDVVMPDGTRIPAFRGARAVADALAVSSSWVGATLHRVTASTDRGPVMARKPLRIEAGEEEAHLMERVHELERGVVRAGVMRWLYEPS